MKDRFWIFPMLAYGDNIVSNGLARVIARRESQVIWVTDSFHHRVIKEMFSDVDNLMVADKGNVKKIWALLESIQERKLPLGYFHPDWRLRRWDSGIYEVAGIDFEERWRSFSLPQKLLPFRNQFSGTRQVAIVHHIPERGFLVDKKYLPEYLPLQFIRPGQEDFWIWAARFDEAREIHLVDSCFLNLAESLFAMGYLQKTRLVFHRYAKLRKVPMPPPILRAPWTVLD